MLMAAKENLQIDLSKSWVVGSGPIDVKADVAAGARTILLNDKLFKHPVPHPVNSANGFGADFIAPNLIEPVKVITQQRISKSNNAPHTLTQPQKESLSNINTPPTAAHINPNQSYPDQAPNHKGAGKKRPIAAAQNTVQLSSSMHTEPTKGDGNSHTSISPATRTLDRSFKSFAARDHNQRNSPIHLRWHWHCN